VRVPTLAAEPEDGARLGALANAGDGESLLVDEGGEQATLPPRFALTAGAVELAALLDAHPQARWLILAGALPDRFMRELVAGMRRRERELTVIVADATRVFLAEKGLDWYLRQGLAVRVLRPIELLALTVNPLAPESHRFDSGKLRARLSQAIADVPIYDVLDPGYLALAK
jgi:hypothetical protein